MTERPEEAMGFTVRTPASDVVDLETESAVEVKRSGATRVHVPDGMVQFRDPAKHAGSVPVKRRPESEVIMLKRICGDQ